MVKPSALLLATRDNAPYHPLGPVEKDLVSLFSAAADLTIATDPAQLMLLVTGRFQLVICYADLWEQSLADGQLAALQSFVAEGGGLLVLHNGICFQSRPEFASLVGAKFTGHPPACSMRFRLATNDHPLLRGVSASWSMHDEPYRFEFTGAEPVTPLVEYEHEGTWYPAAWTKAVGNGQVVYLMPGHDRTAFLNPDYRGLVSSAAVWLLAHSSIALRKTLP